jgi:hypothetical protein
MQGKSNYKTGMVGKNPKSHQGYKPARDNSVGANKIEDPTQKQPLDSLSLSNKMTPNRVAQTTTNASTNGSHLEMNKKSPIGDKGVTIPSIHGNSDQESNAGAGAD